MGAKENFINKKRLYTTEDDYRNKPTTMTNLLPFKKKLTQTDKPNDNGNKPITTTKLLPKAKKKTMTSQMTTGTGLQLWQTKRPQTTLKKEETNTDKSYSTKQQGMFVDCIQLKCFASCEARLDTYLSVEVGIRKCLL